MLNRVFEYDSEELIESSQNVMKNVPDIFHWIETEKEWFRLLIEGQCSTYVKTN